MTASLQDYAVSTYQEPTQNSENKFLDWMLPLLRLETISFYYTEFCHNTIVHGFMAPPTEILKLCKPV